MRWRLLLLIVAICSVRCMSLAAASSRPSKSMYGLVPRTRESIPLRRLLEDFDEGNDNPDNIRNGASGDERDGDTEKLQRPQSLGQLSQNNDPENRQDYNAEGGEARPSPYSPVDNIPHLNGEGGDTARIQKLRSSLTNQDREHESNADRDYADSRRYHHQDLPESVGHVDQGNAGNDQHSSSDSIQGNEGIVETNANAELFSQPGQENDPGDMVDDDERRIFAGDLDIDELTMLMEKERKLALQQLDAKQKSLARLMDAQIEAVAKTEQQLKDLDDQRRGMEESFHQLDLETQKAEYEIHQLNSLLANLSLEEMVKINIFLAEHYSDSPEFNISSKVFDLLYQLYSLNGSIAALNDSERATAETINSESSRLSTQVKYRDFMRALVAFVIYIAATLLVLYLYFPSMSTISKVSEPLVADERWNPLPSPALASSLPLPNGRRMDLFLVRADMFGVGFWIYMLVMYLTMQADGLVVARGTFRFWSFVVMVLLPIALCTLVYLSIRLILTAKRWSLFMFFELMVLLFACIHYRQAFWTDAFLESRHGWNYVLYAMLFGFTMMHRLYRFMNMPVSWWMLQIQRNLLSPARYENKD